MTPNEKAVIEAALEWHAAELEEGAYPDAMPVTRTDYASNALLRAVGDLRKAALNDLVEQAQALYMGY